MPHPAALARAASFTRDRSRSPMPWSKDPNAGFTSPGARPWLPIHPEYRTGINVAEQEANKDSRLNFIRHLLVLRRRYPALVYGTYEPIHPEAMDYIAFKRCDPESGQTVLVAVNMSDQEVSVELGGEGSRWTVLYSTDAGRESEGHGNRLKLSAGEIILACIVH
jgi:glycosidase